MSSGLVKLMIRRGQLQPVSSARRRASGLVTLLLFCGGLGGGLILHNRQHPATATSPHLPHASVPSLDAVQTPSDTPLPPTPTPTPVPTPTPTPSGAQTWAQAQALLGSARGYHVTYGSYYVYPAGSVAGNPLRFDLTVQPSGDFQAPTHRSMGSLAQFDIRRLGGVLAVRHLDTVGNFGNPNAPPDAMQFFNVTYDQANSLGDNWLPLTASPQRPAANVLSAALADYVSAAPRQVRFLLRLRRRRCRLSHAAQQRQDDTHLQASPERVPRSVGRRVRSTFDNLST